MGRTKGEKFSFPIPGRRSNRNAENTHPIAPPSPVSPAPEWHHPVYDAASRPSKAERLLGTGNGPYRPASREHQTPHPPPTPKYMTISVADSGFGSGYSDVGSEYSGGHSLRPQISIQNSPSTLSPGYQDNYSRNGSVSSAATKRLHNQASNSTLRSYYDPNRSPPAISQQTSMSAVRDRALRKGRPPVTFALSHEDLSAPTERRGADDDWNDTSKKNRKPKPPRIDLSKLFPKPKGGNGSDRNIPLLSPNKVMSSPTAMSALSDYYPREHNQEHNHAKLVKRRVADKIHLPPAPSPRRLDRDEYDNAKVHVRKPPQGIKHWFDGISDDSDEERKSEDVAPDEIPSDSLPPRHSSLLRPGEGQHEHRYVTKKQFAKNSRLHPDGTSEYSVQTSASKASIKTKDSLISQTNLQTSSVLSFSSDEDEVKDEVVAGEPLRESVLSTDNEGEIIIGKANAYEIRPSRNRPSFDRRASESRMSTKTASTNAATIEVMYTPEPYTGGYPSPSWSYNNKYASSRRSSQAHTRQPSVIPEDDSGTHISSHSRSTSKASGSLRSGKLSSKSEPKLRSDHHKLMAVTAEEEALLEMMRQKRTAMAKQSFTAGYKTALAADTRLKTPPETKKGPRTSVFLSMDSPPNEPVSAGESSPDKSKLDYLPVPGRGRSPKADSAFSRLKAMTRDNSADSGSTRHTVDRAGTPSSRLSMGAESSTSEAFPPTAEGMASPTTISHASPLPSPVTPGPRTGGDVMVRVASSEPSCDGDGDEDMPVQRFSTGVIEPLPENGKPMEAPTHQRRRTASSGADGVVPKHSRPQSNLQTSSRLSVTIEGEFPAPPSSKRSSIEPKVPRKSSKRNMGVSKTSSRRTSRQCSIQSGNRSRTPSEGPGSNRVSQGLSVRSSSSVQDLHSATLKARCSVSEDVLAAWGSLGGWRDYDSGRIIG